MGLKLLKSGFSTTIQDIGRYGFQDKGIPVSGFMDTEAAQLANLLVNNNPHEALFEMTLLGSTFKATKKVCFAVTGANMQPKINNKIIKLNKAYFLYKNDILSFSNAETGVYCYVAVSDSLEISSYFNSKSTYVPAKIGGLHGEFLKKGDFIKTAVLRKSFTIPNTHLNIKTQQTNILKCLKGPEWHSFSKISQNQFLNTVYTVDGNSNRIGIRLNGTKIEMPQKDEIISSGILKGTVQITKAGFPIVMMADAPTTGGYLRIVNLTEDACNKLAQIPIGNIIQFEMD